MRLEELVASMENSNDNLPAVRREKRAEVLSSNDVRVEIERLLPKDFTQERFVALINAVPYIGGIVSTWIGQNQQREAWRRCVEVLNLVAETLDKIQQKESFHIDEEFAEIVTSLMPYVARTRSEDKRMHYAFLLANAAMSNSPERNEETNTMAILLDQMEFRHVEMLDRLIRQANVIGHDGLWGATREIPVDYRNFRSPDGNTLLYLQTLGLAYVENLRKILKENLPKTRESDWETVIEITDAGVRLHYWITKPEE